MWEKKKEQKKAKKGKVVELTSGTVHRFFLWREKEEGGGSEKGAQWP